MTIPNFFIVGAPKCGTTALCEYLRAHPNVFMSYPKEPHYFATDLEMLRVTKTEEAYLALFNSSAMEHTAVGEASVWYLSSASALQNIHAFNKHAKIIVMLRNPIELVHALHVDSLFRFDEDRSDFREAWDLQEERKRGRYIPETCVTPELLQYRNIARLGDQLERLYAIFPKDQVKCIVFDDFAVATDRVYREVLSHLDVPDDGRKDFPAINQSRLHKSQFLGKVLLRPPRTLRFTWRQAKRLLGNDIIRGAEWVVRANSRHRRRDPMDPAFRQQLAEEFRADTEKLSQLLNRDLSHWIAN